MNANSLSMKANRINWKLADVHHTTMLLPGPYAEYLKGLIAVLNGIVLMEKVEQHDEHVLDAFSVKQPRLPFSAGDVLLEAKNLGDAAVGTEQYEELMAIVKYMNEREAEQAAGAAAAEEGDDMKVAYHMARDYALSYLIRGAYKMYQERKAGRAIPEEYYR